MVMIYFIINLFLLFDYLERRKYHHPSKKTMNTVLLLLFGIVLLLGISIYYEYFFYVDFKFKKNIEEFIFLLDL